MLRSFTLASLPVSAKTILTLFLAMIGFGYIAALGNLFHRHALADGKEGLSIDDLRVTFHGMTVTPDGGQSAESSVEKSRMLQMVEPGGDMRKHLVKGGAEAVRALELWLRRGALEDEFTRGALVQEGDPSAESVILRRCLRCHNVDDGEKADTPYGPDLFDCDYEMVVKYAAPGTAEVTAGSAASVSPEETTLGPQTLSHLFLVTHIHMLSIPVFTLIVSALFLLTNLSPRIRHLLAPIPMISVACEFASWWLARSSEIFLYVILLAGPVFGAAIAVQLLIVFASLWFGRGVAGENDRR